MRFRLTIVFFVLGFFTQANEPSSAIYLKLQKLGSLKRVLYVAAHPDDENTRALAWFSLGEKAETAYFSLTRGDGGQNLIGKELSDELGVLRTQELLAARSFDKATQYFSRAVDFGYSKSETESFHKWGKDELLSDLVLMIRKFKPDVIITRFPPDERGGHGHHTASAVLAIEAFEKAADPNFLKEQVKSYGVWQATSIYWNTSYWWVKDIEDLAKNDPDYLITDIGGYNSQLGMSYNEIGTLARSQHKCQGFGDIVERGSRTEYFQYLGGKKLKTSFFEENKASWSELVNAEFDKKLQSLLDNFNFTHPEKNVPELMAILDGLEKLPASFFRDQKLKHCKEIIRDCLGLNAELIGDDFAFIKGDSLHLNVNLINRSDVEVYLKGFALNTGDRFSFDEQLGSNAMLSKKLTVLDNAEYSTPYWLKEKHGDLFVVKDPANLTLAEASPAVVGTVQLTINGKPFEFELNGEYKWRDPAYGERRRPLISVPAYTANFEEGLSLMKPGAEKTVQLKIHSFRKDLSDVLHVVPPKGWTVKEAEIPVDIPALNGEITVSFILLAGEKAESGELVLKDAKGNALYSLTEITYDHIPTQTLLSKAAFKCIPLNAKIVPGRVAYIKGVDDEVPKAIEQLGFEVDVYEVSDLPKVNLSEYQSVVLGIRIYNVHSELRNFDPQLQSYVQNGGNLIMQYNTASRSAEENSFTGLLPFQLSRERVTEEDAPVHFLAPEHPVMNHPNTITEKDFEQWVQERGLYFATEWDDTFVPLFSWADEGEEALEGAMLVAKYGKGQFIYTGISFFRELPNGVTGAYRLFANMLSYRP